MASVETFVIISYNVMGKVLGKNVTPHKLDTAIRELEVDVKKNRFTSQLNPAVEPPYTAALLITMEVKVIKRALLVILKN